MKKNLMPLIGVAFIAALIATGIFYGILMSRLRPQTEASGPQAAVVATRGLDRGALLRVEDLAVVNWSAGALPKNAVREVDPVVGLTLLEPLSPNQPLTLSQVAQRGSVGGASLAIPPGLRAVSIHPGDSGGIVAMLRSGSRVDIQVIDARPQNGAEMQLRRLLQNVEVLSTGGPEGHQARPVVTVLVSPADADRLSLADVAMQIRLVLRNPSDHDTGSQSGLAPSRLFTRNTAAAVPAAVNPAAVNEE